jgi:hypothetical protein
MSRWYPNRKEGGHDAATLFLVKAERTESLNGRGLLRVALSGGSRGVCGKPAF